MKYRTLNDNGFTLMELMVVVAIIGILATIAIPNYSRMVDRSTRASCVSNQRAVCRDAAMYANEIGMLNGSFNVGLLLLAGYANEAASMCSENIDGVADDYFIEITDGQVSSMICDVNPADHAWTCGI